MSANRTKLIAIVSLGVLLCIFCCVSIVKNLGIRNASEKSPIRTFVLQINEGQREELFAQLRNFSDKHGLEFYLSFYKNKEVFFIVMQSERLEITVSPKPITTTEVQVSFFEKTLAIRLHRRQWMLYRVI